MLPYTKTIAKPMLPVLGKPFLEHQIELLRRNGIRRFLLLVGYLGEQIESYFRGAAGHSAEIQYSYESSPLGTGGALKNAVGCLDEEFLLLNGDTLLEIDYAGLVREFHRGPELALMTASRKTSPGPGNVLLSGDGLVLAYSKPRPSGEHVDAGVIAVRKQVVELIPPNRSCSFEEEILPKLIENRALKAFATDVPFFDMGTPAGLAALQEHLA